MEIIGWTNWDAAERRVEKGEYKDCYDELTEKEIREIKNVYAIIFS